MFYAGIHHPFGDATVLACTITLHARSSLGAKVAPNSSHRESKYSAASVQSKKLLSISVSHRCFSLFINNASAPSDQQPSGVSGLDQLLTGGLAIRVAEPKDLPKRVDIECGRQIGEIGERDGHCHVPTRHYYSCHGSSPPMHAASPPPRTWLALSESQNTLRHHCLCAARQLHSLRLDQPEVPRSLILTLRVVKCKMLRSFCRAAILCAHLFSSLRSAMGSRANSSMLGSS